MGMDAVLYRNLVYDTPKGYRTATIQINQGFPLFTSFVSIASFMAWSKQTIVIGFLPAFILFFNQVRTHFSARRAVPHLFHLEN
jgi:hypothetical protein